MRASFVPPPDIHELRDLVHHRRTLGERCTRAIQRLKQDLQDAEIKVTPVASTPLRLTGRAILDALLGGETDPAELAKGRLRPESRICVRR